MSEILNEIIFICGEMFIFFIGCTIIGAIILKIKEITYDAHQNLIELNNLKRKCKEAREEIEKQSYPESAYGVGYGKDKVVSMDLVREILDKLIESVK